ncbi:MAG: histidinol-phosphate transaminase [Candidatus Rokubacteria bacterium]|nr:histidinol-phosphate transaminase [Candidatus Rokubacteria bacterium]MBI2490553.1 histidinol-phosphate transaminase [Candidatus Rokubacteria bacterium]MBI4253504.1 histidinol-phosphate transaminase [Candidatus Rokubacteria bacterium]
MSTQWESLANEHILGIAPYEPGKPIEELERELGIHDAIKLASNENPLPPSDRVQKAIRAALAVLNRYPDGSGFYLRQALAKKHGFTPDQIVLGNGSNELIELLVRAFLRPGDEAVVPHPSFVVYPMIVQAAGGVRVMVMLKDHRLDLEAMARAITPMTKLVFIANPNNPTATIVTADEVEHFMARVPDRTIVVFDEAYIEFAMGPDFPETLAHVKQGRRVVVLRTFSKASSLAGLRVGYGVADADAIALMNRIRQPFNVNALGQAAALAALEDDAHILECVRMIEAGRHFLYDEFKTLGVSYVPSRANFILVDVGRSAADIYQKLLHQGVIVRPMTPFGMETALRITVGTPEENRKLVKALRDVLEKKTA